MEAELKATLLTPAAMAEPLLKPRETPRTLGCLAIMAERGGSCDERGTEAKRRPGRECQSPWPSLLIWAGAAGLGFRGIKGKIRSIPGLGLWHRPIFLAPAEHVTKHTYRSHWEGKAYGPVPSLSWCLRASCITAHLAQPCQAPLPMHLAGQPHGAPAPDT